MTRIARSTAEPGTAVPVPRLSLPSDYLGLLVVTVRGLQARESEVDEDSGSNPTDDGVLDAVQDTPGDLTREEIREELQGLNDRQQAELVALMWIGRGDAEPEDFEATVQLARDLKERPTPHYLLAHPLVAEHWAEGAERLGIALDIGGSEDV